MNNYNIRVSAGFPAPSSFKMRLAGGAWCIAALILTNFYSSELTSLITVTSSPVPIANSIEEVANNVDIKLVIPKGLGAAAVIAVCRHLHYIQFTYCDFNHMKQPHCNNIYIQLKDIYVCL